MNQGPTVDVLPPDLWKMAKDSIETDHRERIAYWIEGEAMRGSVNVMLHGWEVRDLLRELARQIRRGEVE